MNLWVRIWKTLELLMGTVTAIGHELIQYYLSPYALYNYGYQRFRKRVITRR